MNNNKINDMFYGATSQIFENAKMLRDKMTEAENKLWEQLNNKQLEGYKFRRQHPCNDFIVDFYCHNLKLIIEVDGEYHNENEQKGHDEARTEMLNEFGLTVLRFTNEGIDKNMERVLNQIQSFITNQK